MPTPVADHAAKEAATLARIEAALTSVTGDIASLKARIAVLEGGNPPPPPPPPPPGDDAAILAEFMDDSVAGIDKRLGPKATGANTAPDVWTRPQVPSTDMGWNGGLPGFATYSEGLAITLPPPSDPTAEKPWFDYESDELGYANASDKPLVPNPANPSAVNSDGIPQDSPGPSGATVNRLRLHEAAQGMVKNCPEIPWNDQHSIPDRQAVDGHTASFGMGNQLGQCIDFVRGRINRTDGAFAIYNTKRGLGYIGTAGTKTARSPWSGLQLPDNFLPICACVSSQNEFLYVCGHDNTTGKGQMITFVLWGGHWGDGGSDLPFDFYTSHPGLLQSGVVIGMKIIGKVDLPVKWPTSVSMATSRAGNDRIEGPNGDAAYLRAWNFITNSWGDTFDMSTQDGRDKFLAKNGSWVPNWGKIVVTSKSEGKVVQLDATALYQGYRDQYFTTQEKYDAARPTGDPAGNFWERYDYKNPAVWPYMLPAWVPTVTRVFDAVRPTKVWMLETGDGAFVVGDESGMLRWFKDDGTPNGTLQLGGNITSIRDEKYTGGVRNGYLVVTSRVARTVYIVKDKAVSFVIQDAKFVDPVDAGGTDTHGIDEGLIWIADFDGKKIFLYRYTKLRFGQGGAIFGTGPTAVADKEAADQAVKDGNTPNPPVESLECCGWFDLQDSPFIGADSNVN